MELKDKLTELRNERGLSQLAVAEALDVSRQAVSRWETGASMPSTENLIELSRLYDVPLDELAKAEERAAAESGADSESSAAQRRASIRRRLAAAALVLAALAAIIGAYMLGRGDRNEVITDSNHANDEIIDANDMEEREIPDFEDISRLPWEDE